MDHPSRRPSKVSGRSVGKGGRGREAAECVSAFVSDAPAAIFCRRTERIRCAATVDHEVRRHGQATEHGDRVIHVEGLAFA